MTETAEKTKARSAYREPHAEAVAAMWLFGHVYSGQPLGAVDFYEQLPEGDKALCRQLVREIVSAPGGREP